MNIEDYQSEKSLNEQNLINENKELKRKIRSLEEELSYVSRELNSNQSR